jgi:hypothetical protein
MNAANGTTAASGTNDVTPEPTSTPTRRSGTGGTVLALSGLVLAAALALDVLVVPAEGPFSPSVPMAPSAGGVVCPGVAGAVARDVDLVLVSPTSTDPSRSARGSVRVLGGDAESYAVGPVATGAHTALRLDVGLERWVWSAWADRPIVAWREWRTAGGPAEPRGRVTAACVATAAATWTLVGLRTDGGHEAFIDVANPFAVDATFAVTFHLEGGIEQPLALRNVSVAAGARERVRLNDVVPEQQDVVAVVTVGAGRLAVEGQQRAIGGLGGVEGATSVPAVTAPAMTWTVPWMVAQPDVESAVWIFNPSARAVDVGITVHGPDGAVVPDELDRVEVAAGMVLRLDAADLAPAGMQGFGVTLRSETAPVLVAAGARFTSDEPDRTGIVRYPGVPDADAQWSFGGTWEPGRTVALDIVNLSSSPAPLVIDLRTGPRAGQSPPDEEDPDGEADDAEGADPTPVDAVTAVPAAGRRIEGAAIAPGAYVRFVLPLDTPGTWSADVWGGDALVVARSDVGREQLEPVVVVGVPSRAWLAPLGALPGRQLDGWVGRLGTSTDLRPAPRPMSASEVPSG